MERVIMNILLIGQMALHWGRLEFGNMGNYYIIEPFIKEIHRVFPNAHIKTVFQMSKEFCSREKITVLPMELYYGYRDDELEIALNDLKQAEQLVRYGSSKSLSSYVQEVQDADMVLDLSGDMWGDNADIAGKDRFEVGLIRDRIAQVLGKPVYMLAGSPGPFDGQSMEKLEFARKVFGNFDLVTNREPVSRFVLEKYGFETNNVKDCACPSFLFEPHDGTEIVRKVREKFLNRENALIGFILCGWNFEKPPFSRWPREEKEYERFVALLESICKDTDANICLISHSNGFPIPPEKFELQHGRDYWIVEKLYSMVKNKGLEDRITLIEDVCDVWTTKGIISKLDMLISGRVHGAVAGISQCVPTVIIDYGQEPKAHKLYGFAKLVSLEDYIASPNDEADLQNKVLSCWKNRTVIRKQLEDRVPEVLKLARDNLELVYENLKENEKIYYEKG